MNSLLHDPPELALEKFEERYQDIIKDEVSEENKALITSIMTQCKIPNKNIQIRNSKKKKDACVIHEPGYLPGLFIDEAWFSKLDTKKKQYIIGHEAVHLKYDCGIKMVIRSTSWVLPLCIAFIYDCTNRQEEQVMQTLYLIPLSILGSVACNLLSYHISRQQEFRADRKASLALDCADGGITLLESKNDHQERSFSEQLRSTHPTYDARIKALKKLQSNLSK